MKENNKHKAPMMGPPVMEKPKNFKLGLSKLVRYAKSYKNLIFVAIILAAISSILSIIGPNKLKDITNLIISGIMTGIDMKEVNSIALFLVIIYSISAIFGYLQGFIMNNVTQKFAKSLRKDISTKINRLPLSYFDKTSYGDVLSRVTNDVDTISQTMNQSVAGLVSAVTLFIGSIAMMTYTNGIMSITAIVATIVGFVLMVVILSKSQKYFAEQQEQLGDLNGHIEEIYSGHNVVKVYNAEEDALNKFDKINNKLFESARKSQFLSSLMMPIMSFIGNFGYVAVCIVGAILVMNKDIDFGVIVAFMIYIRLFTQPLSTIAQSFSQLQSTAAASERVFEFLEEEEMTKENKKIEVLKKDKVEGFIEFENVKFGYNKDKLVIKDFTAKAKPGDKIAIVGPTGAGKTTMVNLLMKFYDIDSGNIKIDGVSTKDLTRENIHELFCMVLQDTWLFNGTIKENIVYNQKHITDEEVIEACKTVGLDFYIRSLPEGYNTVLSDSESLSAGQKQLLTIARGMVLKAPFLILDEATSNVDSRTEILVQKAMDKLTEGKTSFIIAHRLSTIKNADLILVMKDGNIIEQGNHEDLLSRNGFYADLYNSQFEKTE